MNDGKKLGISQDFIMPIVCTMVLYDIVCIPTNLHMSMPCETFWK
jgi:hypothetical protein